MTMQQDTFDFDQIIIGSGLWPVSALRLSEKGNRVSVLKKAFAATIKNFQRPTRYQKLYVATRNWLKRLHSIFVYQQSHWYGGCWRWLTNYANVHLIPDDEVFQFQLDTHKIRSSVSCPTMALHSAC